MPRFEICFLKTVSNDTGHQRETCQFHVVVDASDETAAIVKAELEFCRSRHISDWKSHADAYELRPVDGDGTAVRDTDNDFITR